MMGGTKESRNDLMQRMQSSLGTSPSALISTQQQLQSHLFSNRFDPSKNPHAPPPPFRNFSLGFCSENNSSSSNRDGIGNCISNKKPTGIPPSHPNIRTTLQYSQISTSLSRSPTQHSPSQTFGSIPGHSRSLSQPAGFSWLDSFPPLSPPPYKDTNALQSSPPDPISNDVLMDERDLARSGSSHQGASNLTPVVPFGRSNSGRASDSLPPRRAHRKSHSEIPFGFTQNSSLPMMMAPPATLHLEEQGGFFNWSTSAKESFGFTKQQHPQLAKQELDWEQRFDGRVGEKKSEVENDNELMNAYMNLDVLNSSGTEEKHGDMDSRASGTKTTGPDSSENEAESSVNKSGGTLQLVSSGDLTGRKEDTKRSSSNDLCLNDVTSHHSRSISMDSFMGKMNFGEDSLKLPPSPGIQPGQQFRNNSLDKSTNSFTLEFGNGEFNGAELKKIMANEKLAEIAMTDPKRAKRILANRQSAARSKERKMRYISELEHKVQTLQTEATTLSAQFTLLQRDSSGLTSQNNDLKFRLQAMEQQAQLRDALNEALSAEVHHLKVATAELGEANSSSNLNQQLTLKFQMFQLQRQQNQQQPQQSPQQPMFQSQQQQFQHQNQQQQRNDTARNSESEIFCVQ